MKYIKNTIILFAGIGVIAFACALFLPSHTSGQEGKSDAAPPTANVKVVNTASEPVPIAGTVNLANPGTSPLPVRDVDHPARNPFQKQIDAHITPLSYWTQESVPITIPPGKRFVMEHVSAKAIVPIGQKLHMTVVTRFNDALTSQALIAVPQGTTASLGNKDVFTASQLLKAYAGGNNAVPDEAIVVYAERDGEFGDALISFSLSGYFIDVP